MKTMNLTDEQKAALRRDALFHVIPHFASNEGLAQSPKIFVRGEGCYVYDLDGNKYFDSFATLLTTVSCSMVAYIAFRPAPRDSLSVTLYANVG